MNELQTENTKDWIFGIQKIIQEIFDPNYMKIEIPTYRYDQTEFTLKLDRTNYITIIEKTFSEIQKTLGFVVAGLHVWNNDFYITFKKSDLIL